MMKSPYATLSQLAIVRSAEMFENVERFANHGYWSE